MKDEIQMIPVDQIRVINFRHRDKKKFEVIVKSIENLGLKKPIQVRVRDKEEGVGPG
jgi:ParB-like chromosome segregation protein Spo0J